jgi:DNA transformation protein and related proteins
MAASDGTIAFLNEILSPMGRITVRRMFGGAGIYCDSVIFGLIIDDVLYLKADETSAQDFKADGMAPFSYETKSGVRSVMSYWRAPERLFDEPEDFVMWARRSLAISHTAKTAPKTSAAKRKVVKAPASKR